MGQGLGGPTVKPGVRPGLTFHRTSLPASHCPFCPSPPVTTGPFHLGQVLKPMSAQLHGFCVNHFLKLALALTAFHSAVPDLLPQSAASLPHRLPGTRVVWGAFPAQASPSIPPQTGRDQQEAQLPSQTSTSALEGWSCGFAFMIMPAMRGIKERCIVVIERIINSL